MRSDWAILMNDIPVIVLDFETTGLSPQYGDRAIEIGAVRIEDHTVTASFHSLMNPGFRISSFIASYTGISNRMVEAAPPCAEVMEQFAEFIDGHHLVAHNAAFDRRVLDAELGCACRTGEGLARSRRSSAGRSCIPVFGMAYLAQFWRGY